MTVGDGGAPDTGYTVGCYATPDEVVGVVRALWDWKAGHEVPVRCYLRYGSVAITGLEDVGTGTVAGDDVVIWQLGRFIGSKYSPVTLGSEDPYTAAVAKLGVSFGV
jgi:hypothetical protein